MLAWLQSFKDSIKCQWERTTNENREEKRDNMSDSCFWYQLISHCRFQLRTNSIVFFFFFFELLMRNSIDWSIVYKRWKQQLMYAIHFNWKLLIYVRARERESCKTTDWTCPMDEWYSDEKWCSNEWDVKRRRMIMIRQQIWLYNLWWTFAFNDSISKVYTS